MITAQLSVITFLNYFIIKFSKYMAAQTLTLACPAYTLCIHQYVGTKYCEHNQWSLFGLHYAFHVLELNPTAVAHESTRPEEPGSVATLPTPRRPFECYSKSRNTWENNSIYCTYPLIFYSNKLLTIKEQDIMTNNFYNYFKNKTTLNAFSH